MRNQLRRFLPESKFITNVLTLTTGTTLAQASTILATPIITRLYSPEDFGMLALFTSVTGIFSVVACWRYEQAIVLPEKDKQAVDIFALSILVAFGMTFLTFLVMLCGRKNIAGILDSVQLSFWLWFVPLSVLCRGLFLTFNYWSIRKKKFKYLAVSQVSGSITTVGIMIIVGAVLGANVGGLIGGSIAGTVMATTVICVQVWKDDFLKLLKAIKKSDVLVSAIEYRKFPYYSSWAALLNTFSQQIPIWLLTYFFTTVAVGFYSLGSRVLTLPISLITQSVQQVYLQKASELHAYGKSMRASFIKSTLGLIAVGIIPFSILFLFGKPLFIFVFGADWSTAGVYVQIISPWLFLVFINAPAGGVYTVCQKQDVLLIYQILLTIFSGLSILAGYHLFNSVEKSLLFLALTSVIVYLCLIGYAYRLISTFLINQDC